MTMMEVEGECPSCGEYFYSEVPHCEDPKCSAPQHSYELGPCRGCGSLIYAAHRQGEWISISKPNGKPRGLRVQ